MSLAVANRYAKALGEVVFAPGSALTPEQAIAELHTFAGVLDQASELKHILRSPAVASPAKRAVLTKLAEQAGLSRITRNLLLVISDHKRFAMFPDMVAAFQQLVDTQRGIVRAKVTVASELPAETKARLEIALGKLSGKNVLAEYQVDPAVIGGAVAKIGSMVYDGSVRGQLEGLRRKLTNR